MDDQHKKKDLTVADVICRWYVCAVIGFGAGQSLGGGPSGLIGLVVGGSRQDLCAKLFAGSG